MTKLYRVVRLCHGRTSLGLADLRDEHGKKAFCGNLRRAGIVDMHDVSTLDRMLIASNQTLPDVLQALASPFDQTLRQYVHWRGDVDHEQSRIAPPRFRQNGSGAMGHHDIATFQPAMDLQRNA